MYYLKNSSSFNMLFNLIRKQLKHFLLLLKTLYDINQIKNLTSHIVIRKLKIS